MAKWRNYWWNEQKFCWIYANLIWKLALDFKYPGGLEKRNVFCTHKCQNKKVWLGFACRGAKEWFLYLANAFLPYIYQLYQFGGSNLAKSGHCLIALSLKRAGGGGGHNPCQFLIRYFYLDSGKEHSFGEF